MITSNPLRESYIFFPQIRVSKLFSLILILNQKNLSTELKVFKAGAKHPIIKQTKSQLKEYFSGQRVKFKLPLDPDGTDFQKKAWKVLRQIPYGKTLSYQEQAEKLGDINKARAVGTANSRNPIAIVVPCHRVIAKSGSLRGFGGGFHRKKLLLHHEGTLLLS